MVPRGILCQLRDKIDGEYDIGQDAAVFAFCIKFGLAISLIHNHKVLHNSFNATFHQLSTCLIHHETSTLIFLADSNVSTRKT